MLKIEETYVPIEGIAVQKIVVNYLNRKAYQPTVPSTSSGTAR